MADNVFSDMTEQLLEYARKNNDVELALVATGNVSPEAYLFNLLAGIDDLANTEDMEELVIARFSPAIKANETRRKKLSIWLRREQRREENANPAIVESFTQEIEAIDAFSRAVIQEVIEKREAKQKDKRKR